MKKIFFFIFFLLTNLYLYAQQKGFIKIDSSDKKLYASFFQAIAPYDSVYAVETGSYKGKGSIGFIKYYMGQINSGCFLSGSLVNNYLGARGITTHYPFLLFMDTLAKEERKEKYNKVLKAFASIKVNKDLLDTCVQMQNNIDDAPFTVFLKVNKSISVLLDIYAFDEMCTYCNNNKKLKNLFSIKQVMEYIKASINIEEKLKTLYLQLAKQN